MKGRPISAEKAVLNVIIFIVGLTLFIASIQLWIGALTESEEPSCKGEAMCFLGTVDRVIDGDTLIIDGIRVRLALTNAYELKEPGGAEAKAFTLTLCPIGSKVLVDQDDGQLFDRYGRMIAKVYCGDKNLNAELLYNGHGYILKSYCFVSEFSSEKWAKDFGC